MIDPELFLNDMYATAMRNASGKKHIETDLNEDVKNELRTVLDNSERSKAVLTVLLTSLVYKYINPLQDVRRHQQSIEGGYSGRTFDSKYITPFLKEKKFPSMAESGWLTRSLEQKVPYNYDYPGAIKPDNLKFAFLDLLDKVETAQVDVIAVIDFLLQGLIINRDKHKISLARPQNLSIACIIHLLDMHFHSKYSAEGASRLPVLALYAIYKCLIGELKRFSGKMLLPLESHTSADSRSGRIGDIDIMNSDGSSFEAIEVKFDIPINHNILQIAKEKIQPTSVERYYILSTMPINEKERDLIENDIKQIKNTHGCQIVVNGVLQTIKYYLRLLDNVKDFINYYVELLDCDNSIKFEHKLMWNILISKL